MLFDGITHYCGRPTTTGGSLGNWDNWKDANHVKHKGSGVDVIEKARRDPAKWGLTHNSAIDGVCPPRPARVPPPLPSGSHSSHSSHSNHSSHSMYIVPHQPYGSPLTQDTQKMVQSLQNTQSMLQNVLMKQATMKQAPPQVTQVRLLLA